MKNKMRSEITFGRGGRGREGGGREVLSCVFFVVVFPSSWKTVVMTMTDRERQTDRETETQRERETETERQRETETERQRQTETKHRETERDRD